MIHITIQQKIKEQDGFKLGKSVVYQIIKAMR